MDGFLLIDKPKGFTSQDVCSKVKKILNQSHVRHTGTLDPNSTGLMMVGIGRACKLMKLINEHDKEYIATVVFGYDSTTLDITGEITKDIPMSFTLDELKKVLDSELKREKQLPPLTSAVHVNGMRLYEYQRENIEVEVPLRDVHLDSYEIISDLRLVDNHLEIDIKLNVSKGYYVRSLARDLGIALNGCAILKELRRTKLDKYNVINAQKLDEITPDKVISITNMFDLPKVEVNNYIAHLVMNGVVLDNRQTTLDGVFYVTNNCDIIAIYEKVSENRYKPILIFK